MASLDYTQWPSKNPWRITSKGSAVADLGIDDTLDFLLVISDLKINDVQCTHTPSPPPPHAGNCWKTMVCIPQIPTDTVYGQTLCSPFVQIQIVGEDLGGNHFKLTCTKQGITGGGGFCWIAESGP